MSVAEFTVFGFETTHDAMRAESTLEGADVPLTLIPTPKALGAHCGLAARVRREDARTAAQVLADADVRVSATIEIEDRTNP